MVLGVSGQVGGLERAEVPSGVVETEEGAEGCYRVDKDQFNGLECEQTLGGGWSLECCSP